MYRIEVEPDGDLIALTVSTTGEYRFADGTTTKTVRITDAFIPKVGTTVTTSDGIIVTVKDTKVDDNGVVWVLDADSHVWGRL